MMMIKKSGCSYIKSLGARADLQRIDHEVQNSTYIENLNTEDGRVLHYIC